ncbi:transcriptional regulator, AsnC family [Segniliparus rotundus DSM 44985]|uniref:Transcriptional regulator, AsnC family n=1 Tax=Segniliparus rotundus (strain ATCC BAA-972 / CDC 1076 / CIP 108378 / DSM 44985 / JCM 13578) TaxID=640132 RepID=D6ZFR0_SEGRD|nr:Lrp/AsnC family transcriptional regulator [Segniliparus rotundus]ADG97784.1 transcriptional regulator, AsnC family [Segniliparus rotundus DSM 44985]
MTSAEGADALDARLLTALSREPRASVIALAEQSGVSRNTVHARLNRWDQRRVLLPFDHRIDPAFLGYPMRAFIRAQLEQQLLSEVSSALSEIDEVIEVLGLSGGDDVLIQVVARDADDLYRVAGQVLAIRGVRRTNTSLVMRELVGRRTLQLIDKPGALAEERGAFRHS